MVEQAFVEQLVLRELGAKRRTFFGTRQLAEDEQHGGFDKRTAFGQLLDGDAAITQDALFAVDKGDGGLAGAGVGVARVKGEQSGVLLQAGDVDADLAFGADEDGKFEGLVTVGQDGGFAFAHGTPRAGREDGENGRKRRGAWDEQMLRRKYTKKMRSCLPPG